MTYCFVDLSREILSRYPARIARAIEKIDPAADFIFIHTQKDREEPAGAFPERSRFVYSPSPAVRNIIQTLDRERPAALIVLAQRLQDSAYVSAARLLGIPTIMFQHGLYIPFMRREPLLFVREFAKSIRYARYAAAIARMHERSRLRYVLEFIKVFIFGRPYAQAAVDHEKLNVDLVLLNGEYWREYHSANFCYPESAQIVVGYPDFEQLERVESATPDDAVCYIAQTLVEDGRLDGETFASFIEAMAEAFEERRLMIKFHPRSDRDLFRPLLSMPNVTIADAMPRASGYIGHYSTFLALVPFLTADLFLWEFQGHPIPSQLRDVARHVSNDREGLARFVEAASASPPDAGKVAEFERYFWRPQGVSVYDLVAENVIGLARDGVS